MIELLDDLANLYNTDKGTKYTGDSRHGYAPIYERYFLKWKMDEIRILEVGVWMEFSTGGESLLMWRDYFKNAKIYAFDVRDMYNHEVIMSNDRIFFYRGDQGYREDFEFMYEAFGSEPFEFILEDGSHYAEHQMISLGALFKYVKSGGYYILEDMSIPDHPVCCIRNDETYKTVEKFQSTGVIESPYLLPNEKEYLEKNVLKIEIYPDMQDAYATAIITKK